MMTSYIYIAGEDQLPYGSIGSYPKSVHKNRVIFKSLLDMESFYFEPSFNEQEDSFFSYSAHFTLKNYQVASIDNYLPTENNKFLSPKQKKALDELYNFIAAYFDNAKVLGKLEILYCLNGEENKLLKIKKQRTFAELTLEDLYADDLKFLTIIK